MLFTATHPESQTFPVPAGVVRRNSPLEAAPVAVSASRRRRPLEVDRDETGEISQVRIGPWRKVISRPSRTVAEVRPLLSGHVAVRVQNGTSAAPASSRTVWQLYHPSGHLLAMMQPNAKGEAWVTTHFKSPETDQTLSESQLFVSA